MRSLHDYTVILFSLVYRLRKGRADYVLVRNSDVSGGAFSLTLKMFGISNESFLSSFEISTDPRELINVVFCNDFRVVVVSCSSSDSTTCIQYFDFLRPLKRMLAEEDKEECNEVDCS